MPLFKVLRDCTHGTPPTYYSRGDVIDWLCGVGFAVQRPFTRMALGEPRSRPRSPVRQFAICGPEFG